MYNGNTKRKREKGIEEIFKVSMARIFQNSDKHQNHRSNNSEYMMQKMHPKSKN